MGKENRILIGTPKEIREVSSDLYDFPFDFCLRMESQYGDYWVVPHDKLKPKDNLPILTPDEIKELKKINDNEQLKKVLMYKINLSGTVIKHGKVIDDTH